MPTHYTKSSPGRLVDTSYRSIRVVGGRLDERSVDLQAFVPHPLPPKVKTREFLAETQADVLLATSELARLDGLSHWLPDPHLLLFPLFLREAKMSSRIENTVSSIEEVTLAGTNPALATDDAREIRNYVSAMRHGMDSPLPMCRRLLLEMHRILLESTRGEDKTPGYFRTGQVIIGDEFRSPAEARFIPPPAGRELSESLDQWERFVNTPEPELPTVVAVALAHYQFEAIHPFRDGNGRIGRAAASLSLCKSPKPLLSRPFVYVSGYFDKHRQHYYDLLLRVSTHGDWSSWTRFFCQALASEAVDSASRIKRLIDLRDDFVKRVSKPKDSAALPLLINLLFQHPVVSINKAAELLTIPPQSALRLVNRLVDRGILTEITGKNYGRSWSARELLAVIDDESEPI